MRFIFLFGCLFTLTISAFAQPLVFDKRPLAIELPVGSERLLIFDEPVTFNTPHPNAQLTHDQLRVHVLGETVYVTAHTPFSAMRVYVSLPHSQHVIALNLSASEHATDRTPQRITTAQAQHTPQESSAEKPAAMIVTLLRFAIQQLYAPEPAHAHATAIHRTPMRLPRTTAWVLPMPQLTIRPLASWKHRAYYVTALSVTNTAPTTTVIAPAQLCGDLLAATLFPRHQLAARGQPQDHTTLLVVTTQPFVHATRTCHGRV